MQFPFDNYLKSVLREPLITLGEVRTEEHVAPDAQRIDLCFEPRPGAGPPPAELGLVGRVGESSCILEPFHAPPTFDEVRGAIRKQLAWHHVQVLRAMSANRSGANRRARGKDDGQPRRQGSRLEETRSAVAPRAPPGLRPAIPVLWIISSGRPRGAVEAFAFKPLSGWPAGVFATPQPAVPVRLIVVTELPETRETLLLRLMGRGAVLRRATAELSALPPQSWERTKIAPFVVELMGRLSKKAEGQHPLTVEEREFLVTGQQMINAIEKRAIQKGRQEGRQEGRQAGREEGREEGRADFLALVFTRKLGRPLTDRERATLSRRLASLGAERLGDVVLELDAPALAAWLARPRAR